MNKRFIVLIGLLIFLAIGLGMLAQRLYEAPICPLCREHIYFWQDERIGSLKLRSINLVEGVYGIQEEREIQLSFHKSCLERRKH